MNIFSKKLFGLLLLGILGIAIYAAESKKPAVLFITHNHPVLHPSHAYKVMLDKQGYALNSVAAEKVTPEILRKYNCVVLFGVPIGNPNNKNKHKVDALIRMICDYAKEGGGVLFCSSSNAPAGYGYGHAEMAKAFGGRMLWEPVHDPQETGIIGVSSKNFSFAYTAELNQNHPVTKGLNGIWYQTTYGARQNFGVLPWLVNKPWTILVKGSSKSYSTPTKVDKKILMELVDANPRKQGYKSFVPIIVARDFYKGRVVMCSIDVVFHLMSGDSPGLRGIVSDKGLDGRSSDVNNIIFNSIKWLCQPSLAGNRLGGGKTPPGFLDDPLKTKPAPPKDWSKVKFGTGPKQYRGIFGARTFRSKSGSGKVEDYVKEAKKCGLDFVVFMEDWNDLTDEEWSSLLAECKKATEEGTFYAFPGLVLRDIYDGNWFAFDRTFDLPPKAYEKMIDGQKRFMSDRRYATIAKAHLPSHEWKINYGLLRIGSWQHKKASYPYYSCRGYDTMGVISAKGSIVDEEMIKEYLHLQNRGESLYPVAITIINKPEDIEKELQKGMYFNVMTPQTIKNLDAGPGWASLTFMTQDLRYLSNGPRINDFCFLSNIKDYGLFGEWWRTDYYRQPLRISVSSEKGLKEVLLMDGERILRRWLPKGKKQFTQDLILANDEGHALVVIVKDNDGKQAVSSELHTRNFLGNECMCADRCNQLGNAFLKRRDGRKYIYQPITTPNKGTNFIKFWGDYSLAYDPIIGADIRGVDGQASGTTRTLLSTGINSKTAGQLVLSSEFNRTTDRVINSPDITRGWGLTDGRLQLGNDTRRNTNVWDGPMPVKKADDYREWIQRTYFSVTPDLLLVEMIQRRISILKDMDLKKGPVNWSLGYVKKVGAKRIAIRSQGKIVYSGKIGKGNLGLQGRDLTGILEPGDYIVFYDANISNDGFMVYEGRIRFKANLFAGVVSLLVDWDPNKTLIPAGTEINYSLLGIFSPNLSDNFVHDSFQFMEDFRNHMGLDGDVAYKIKPTLGKLISTNYVAVVEAQDGAFVAETEDIDLPATLPLEVRGLNENWSTGYAQLDKKRYRPINDHRGTSFVSLDPQTKKQHFFVGHPVVADDKDIVLNCVQLDNKNWHLEVHNPTDKVRKVVVKPAKGFPFLKFSPKTIEVVPGASVNVNIN